MNEILRFLQTYEVWIYLLLGLVGMVYLRRFLVALNDWRAATFGLEKDNAHWRLTEATSILVILILLAGGEFLLVSFISPTFPGIQQLATPTLDPLATQTATLPAGMSTTNQQVTTPGPAAPEEVTEESAGCNPGTLEFIFPEKGSQISGLVFLKGIVNVSDFGFYKYEFTEPGMDTWITIAAGNTTPQPPDYELGPWDASMLFPGDYRLRLIVIDHQGNSLPPCEIPIRVAAP